MSRLIALMALTGLAAPAGFGAPMSAILGEWRGTYQCSQGVTALKLTLSAGSGRSLKAFFDFGAVEENPNVPHGSYWMRGSFDAKTGRLTLKADKWVVQPAGYVTVDLDGYLNAAAEEVSGVVPAAGCTVFDLKRRGSLVS